MNEVSTRPVLLIVDDDIDLQQLLVQYLREQGFQAEAVGNGSAMDDWLNRHSADLVILDLMLPGEDGLSLARRLRKERDIPIIMLSARGEELDRIIGLEVGADDYLPKPFNPRELLARIRAVLRRSACSQATEDAGTATETDGRLRFGPYSLDTEARLLWKGNEEVDLTQGEMDLLIALATHPHRVLSRDRLLELLDRYDTESFDRSIDVRITRLRRKLGEGNPPRFIRTVWGQGYRFVPDAV